jgi:hypothetical protein
MEEFIIGLFSSLSFVADFTNTNSWVWPIAEVCHFLGLTLLVGAIGVLDLRLLGMAKGLSPAAVHQLVPIGVIGFALSFLSGGLFVASSPSTFIPNPLFQLKMLFVLLAGLNVIFFYLTGFRQTEAARAGDSVPLSARIAGGVSIVLWMGVIITGRFMAWF